MLEAVQYKHRNLHQHHSLNSFLSFLTVQLYDMTEKTVAVRVLCVQPHVPELQEFVHAFHAGSVQ